jgi:hypothetical protein
VGPRAGLDHVEKRKFLTLPGLELRPIAHPARSQFPYRLRYPGSLSILNLIENSNIHYMVEYLEVRHELFSTTANSAYH